MTLILHLSDPHFGTERAAVAEALVQLVHAQSPQLAILSGDITQRARAQEFQAARAFMARLNVPALLAIPGNHDIPLFDLAARLLWPYARYARAFGTDLEPVYETSELLTIGVNTTRRYRHVDGEVSNAQIQRVAARLLQASPAQLRLVVTHQPIHVTYVDDEKNLLHGHAQAAHCWTTAGADLILGGHIHRPFVTALPTTSTSAMSQTWVVQAGTALSSRIRYEVGNSVNLIRCGLPGPGRRCVVERWDYVETTGCFVQVAQHDLSFG